MHCGFCLPTCPSYAVFEDEMDSPRGRILLMRIGHEEGETISPEMVTHFDRCLGCMACVTACPSGVQYDKLIEPVRPQIERSRRARGRSAPTARRSSRCSRIPARLRALVPGAKLGPKLAPLMPTERLKSMLSLAPAKASYRPLPKVKTSKAPGQARDRRVHAGLHPARVLRRRQRRDAAGAVRRGLGGPFPALPALLRRAADALGRRGRGAGRWPRRRSPPTRATTRSSPTSPAAARR